MSNAGRPPKFNNIDELDKLIQEYFDLCVPEEIGLDKLERPIYRLNPPTLTGLSLHLGFVSRQSIYDYEKREEFSYSMKRARLTCENFAEKGLLSGDVAPAAGIFVLKNYGWRDEKSLDISGNLNTAEKKLTDLISGDDVNRLNDES